MTGQKESSHAPVATASHRSVEEILDALAETCSSLEDLLESLQPAEWHIPTGCPGWDVQDVVSHIIGLEDQLAGLPDPDHTLPEGMDHLVDDLRRLEIQVDFRRGLPPEELVRQFHAATKRGLEIRRASDRAAEDITEGPFGWRMPYWRLLSIRTFDCFAHEQDVRRALGRPGNLDGQAAAVVGDLLAEMLPGVVARRVEELTTQRVIIETVTGADGRARRIEIGGVAGGGMQAVTTAAIPFADLLAFACGRADASDDRVSVVGDAGLVARVLGSMGFTP